MADSIGMRVQPKNGRGPVHVHEAFFAYAAMAVAVRGDAAAMGVVHFQRWQNPQLPAPGALEPPRPRPSATCGRRPPGPTPPLNTAAVYSSIFFLV